jgi:uncharacterized membrane protein YgaE (UPF0421/DUF939 family)
VPLGTQPRSFHYLDADGCGCAGVVASGAEPFEATRILLAPISTIVILLSTIDPLALAWQRFAGTAIGATLGALIATFVSPSWVVYGAGIFVCGIVCAALRLGSAYRFAAITLSIVLLIAHQRPPWIVGTHRFLEVSLGIAVALVVAMVWRVPERRTA